MSADRRAASVLALGDSYTIGEGVEPSDRWPAQLGARLRAIGIPVDEPRIVARTGWTTDELLAAIVAERLSRKFDLVTLLVGVNDQYRGYGVARYTEAFATAMRTALAFAKAPDHLVVLSIPDWGVTPFASGRDRAAIGREIDAFNAVNRAAALQAGAGYVDVTPVSRAAASDATLLAADGLHPSAAMYRRWVDLMMPSASAILRGA